MFRKAKRLSQEKLAELAGLHPTYISDIERGKVNASLYSIHLLSSALGIECSDLLRCQPCTTKSEIEHELIILLDKISKLEKKDQALFVSTIKSIFNGLDGMRYTGRSCKDLKQ